MFPKTTDPPLTLQPHPRPSRNPCRVVPRQMCSGICVGYAFYAMQYGYEVGIVAPPCDLSRCLAVCVILADISEPWCVSGEHALPSSSTGASSAAKLAYTTMPRKCSRGQSRAGDKATAFSSSRVVFFPLNNPSIPPCPFEKSRQCWCSSAEDYDMHGDGVCDIACTGDSGVMCGGNYAMSVYANDGGVDPVDPEKPVEPPTDPSYVGCYADQPEPDRWRTLVGRICCCVVLCFAEMCNYRRSGQWKGISRELGDSTGAKESGSPTPSSLQCTPALYAIDAAAVLPPLPPVTRALPTGP